MERAASHLFVQPLHDDLFIGPLANKAGTVLRAIATVDHDTDGSRYPNLFMRGTCAIQELHNFAVGFSAANKHISYHAAKRLLGYSKVLPSVRAMAPL